MDTKYQELAGPLGQIAEGGEDGGGENAAAQPYAARVALKPNRRDCREAVQELKTSLFVRESGVLNSVDFVPVTHMWYFKPPADALLSYIKSWNRRSA